MESRQRRVWHQAAGALFYTRFAQCHARLRRNSIQRADALIPYQACGLDNKKGTFGRQKFLFCWRRRRDLKGYAPTRVVCRELSPTFTRLCSLALWLLRFAKTILNRFCLLALASCVVSFRLRLLGSAHSHFGSFASQKRYSIVFACSHSRRVS